MGNQTTSDTNSTLGMAPGILARPRLGIGDILVQLWRAKWMMAFIFLPIMAAGIALAMLAPKKYEAVASLHVSVGDEYVYRPSVGMIENPPATLAPDVDAMVQSELELINSAAVAERALDAFSIEVLYPDIEKACAEKRTKHAGDASKLEEIAYDCRQSAIEAIQKGFNAGAAPKTPVIGAVFEHKEARLSAEVLNAIIASYLDYRSDVFAGTRTSGFAGQREQFEADLADTERDLTEFLAQNGIGDFLSEKETAKELYQTASGELLKTESRLRQVEGQLKAFREQIENIAPQQNMYVDDSTRQSLLALQLEREELLTRYRPDSRTIVEIDKRIEKTENYLAEQTEPVGTVRRGPNPLYQQIESSLNTLQAESAALRNQRQELMRQIADFEGRQRRLTDLEPEYQELLRRRELLDRNVRSFAEREVEARTHSQLVQESVDNIRVLQDARMPIKGSSLKLPIAALALLLAGFTALMAGLLRAFSRNTFSTAHSVERTLNLPILASVPKLKG